MVRAVAFVLGALALAGCSSPELKVQREETDELGMTHTRYQQTVQGVPVWGAEIAEHRDADGTLVSTSGETVEGLDAVDVTPAVTAAEAHARADGAIEGSELVVYAPNGGTPALAWHFQARTARSLTTMFVDAHTGAVLRSSDALQHDTAMTTQAKGVRGDSKAIGVTDSGGAFSLQTTVNGVSIVTADARHTTDEPGRVVTSSDNLTWDPVAVDAHFNVGAVVTYYKDRHNRHSIDGLGGPIRSLVHWGAPDLDNAFWNGRSMVFGDGDGVHTLSLAAAPEIVGHELSHGVTQATSMLDNVGEPGALNEAWSDVMGAFFTHYLQPDPVRNWIHDINHLKTGEILAGSVRDLRDPQSMGDPDHYAKRSTADDGEGGAHKNSTIMSHAAYLMTMGGRNKTSQIEVKFGIGADKAEKVWYRANTHYWLMKTDFAHAAEGVVQAGKDLKLTPNELNIVQCAFIATGIAKGSCAAVTDPGVATQASAPASKAGASTGDDDDDAASTTKPGLDASESGGCNASSREAGSGAWLLALTLAVLASRRRR